MLWGDISQVPIFHRDVFWSRIVTFLVSIIAEIALMNICSEEESVPCRLWSITFAQLVPFWVFLEFESNNALFNLYFLFGKLPNMVLQLSETAQARSNNRLPNGRMTIYLSIAQDHVDGKSGLLFRICFRRRKWKTVRSRFRPYGKQVAFLDCSYSRFKIYGKLFPFCFQLRNFAF